MYTQPMLRRLLFLASFACLGACEPNEFRCKIPQECVQSTGIPGLCLLEHCAFEDKSCASRYRFDDTAGADAKRCVDRSELPPDAGMPDGRIDAG